MEATGTQSVVSAAQNSNAGGENLIDASLPTATLRQKQSILGDVIAQPEEESFDLSALTISNALPEPITIDGAAEMLRFLQSGTLKGIENVKVRERFIRSITVPRVGKIVRLCFYFILVSNFPECVRFDQEEEMSALLKSRLSKNYVKLFSGLPQPKDEIVNLIIFCLGYTCHLLFYKLFPKQREMFDLRFVFNCYHILIFEFNGIFVSDFFVRMNIDKIFVQHKFLDYERVNKKNMLLQQQAKNKAKTKTFFGFQLAFPDMHGNLDAVSFNRQLQDKFKPAKKNLHILDDQASDQASSQEKQIKIRQELRNKRKKQIEEVEIAKAVVVPHHAVQMQAFQQQQQLAGANNTSSIQSATSSQAVLPHLSPVDGGNNSVHTAGEQQQQYVQQSAPNQHAIKQAMEKADAIFARTEVRYEDAHSTKEDQNYFANLQLNCNQISPTISTLLSYDNRTLPYAKKKMIRHAFETVNDKEDNLLQQLKQFSQSRKQKKETKFQQKVNKSIIDHFGLRPPPREYYQKHPKLDKMFKDMLDINYVLKQNTESMLQLPSSVAMQSEQANEWQQQIIDQENNYNKQNQRQKVQDSLSEVVLKNQLYHLEKRPGYRKDYIYTKPPPQYLVKQPQDVLQRGGTGVNLKSAGGNAASSGGNTASLTLNINAAAMGGVNSNNKIALMKDAIDLNTAIDEVLRSNAMNNTQVMGSPMKMAQSVSQNVNTFSLPSLPSALATASGVGATGGEKKWKGGMGGNANKDAMGDYNPNPHRNIDFKVFEQDSKNNGRGYYEEENETIEQRILKNKQNSDFYNDKRQQYRDTYKGFINNMSTDNNIDDILQNILHKRNQFNRNLRSKIKNL